PDTLIGFLSVDPTQPGWEKELRDGHEELGLRGIKLLPMYAGFHPADERVEAIWKYAAKHKLPVLLHTGTTFVSQAPLEYTLPRHLDTVAMRH
ncbi:amidohydrolase family protein, partial [Rhizobium phaseoli]|uniref:amidohydrolase family protein n=1 Tax=Rhizobium phaseoli TaxID=396 RepID=UPI001436A8B1